MIEYGFLVDGLGTLVLYLVQEEFSMRKDRKSTETSYCTCTGIVMNFSRG